MGRTLVVFLLLGGFSIYFLMGDTLQAIRDGSPLLKARSAIVLDGETGEIVYMKNAQQALPPASMSKMMTELIVLDSINAGQIAWQDAVAASNYAANVIGTQIGFGEGEVFTVRELFEAMVIQSANDAAVALAEYIAGSEQQFVQLMNRKARQLGLSVQTVFGNATGLGRQDLASHREAAAEQETLMTAYDVAILAKLLVEAYPEVLDIASKREAAIGRQQPLAATNLMLPGQKHFYAGLDGLKTGYTSAAGYCFTGTAVQGGKRLYTVVMGAGSSDSRFVETKKLLRFGFEHRAAGIWTGAGNRVGTDAGVGVGIRVGLGPVHGAL